MRLSILKLLLFIPALVFAQDTLREINVSTSTKSLKKSTRTTQNTTVMTGKELLKAACCNLAESFETNPSIDVNFADALTGTRQIRMLGLTSPYLLITEENIPAVRGAAQAYGLSFIPGTWVESIQITKGAGSVANGFESITGQINTELLKPACDIPFFLNFYGSNDARLELNTHINHKFSDKWSSSLFIHGSGRFSENDMNNDGFLDNPLAKQVNIMNRWQFNDQESGWLGFFKVRYLNDEKLSGAIGFNPEIHRFGEQVWGSEVTSQSIDLSAKVGYVFPDLPYQSIGWQNAYSFHSQDSYFGMNTFDIVQKSFYSNLVFNSIIRNTSNKFAIGINTTADYYSEAVSLPGIAGSFDRIDNSIGTFFEYTYDNTNNFSMIAGIRGDFHNRLGAFLTPRLHIRFVPWDGGVLRASGGRGKRIANIFAENQNLFASARIFSLQNANGKIYGLNPEIAWNYGISFSQNFKLFGKPADAGFDFYRTDFIQQVIVDLYAGPQAVNFYNLRGGSYANSFQLDFNYELLTHLNIRASYKWYDIRTDYDAGNFERPLQAQHRFFANLEYATHIKEHGRRWKFDFTANWTGKQRLPFTFSNPADSRLSDYAAPFLILNTQITRTFSSSFEIYIGGENISNYRQSQPILGNNDPFGNYFDASIVYAPIFGQMYYAGLRFKIK